MNYFYPYPTYLYNDLRYRKSYGYDDINPFLSRGVWTPFTWVEKYHYAFSGPFDQAAIALTFDDGPDPIFTPHILDKLKTYGAQATFFLLGENIEKFPDIVKRIAAEGHVIGNHTYAHPNLPQVSDEDYHQQIQKTDALIEQLVGYKPKFFRPPYGAIREDQLQWATEQNMMVIQWSLDTLDWQGLSAKHITEAVMANALPGSIILQHNAQGVPLQGSVDALDQIIPQLQEKATRFVTLPEMFHLDKAR
ncbi:MAG: polysaccharide deacetylase family protein [Defluviitaleaceae bacterium]|nr:polysaccharide deacetylase family protein [Defluviitaleaceae bacterium]